MLHPDARVIIAKHGLYAHHEVHYFRRGVVTPYPELIHFDFTRPINVGNTTGSQLAIPLAVCLGATEIILIGFDCNWLESFTGSYHFYASHDQFPEFDSLKSDERWDRYEDHLIFALRDFEAHRLLATRAAQLGVAIKNATRGGLLDTYPRSASKTVSHEEPPPGSAPTRPSTAGSTPTSPLTCSWRGFRSRPWSSTGWG